MSKKKKAYNAMIADASKTQIAAPELPYQPPKPRRYNPAIGLIGCGGISKTHLAAYKAQGFNVVALCDLDEQRAEDRRAEFFPDAKVYVDYKQVLARDDIEVVDLATHPQDRQALIPAALKAKKHVLSQKPFVLDLDQGEKYVELADKNGVTLAVNQNGRWAPYFSYMRQAINKGLLGETFAAHLSVHWNHEWIRDTHFNRVHHVVLYDFAIHWFDMIHCLLQGRPATRVFSTLTPAGHQLSRPPLLGQTLIEFEGAQASLSFDAVVKVGPFETAYVAGTKATLRSSGNVCGPQTVTLATPRGTASPTLEGNWFNDGFKGSMGELLTSIEKQREPVNSARDNLKSLAICFAAVASADSGKPVKVGSVRKVSKRCMVADE